MKGRALPAQTAGVLGIWRWPLSHGVRLGSADAVKETAPYQMRHQSGGLSRLGGTEPSLFMVQNLKRKRRVSTKQDGKGP